MNLKNILYTLSLSTSLLTFWSCANPQTPQGGPKDKMAPKVIKEYPLNRSTNFKSKKIEIQFDEYFDIKNESKEIGINPALKNSLKFDIKQKTLIVTIKDTLEKNTTYKINFGKSIADVNENNVLKNYSYVFSTGDFIDSLYLVGKVYNSTDNKPEKDVTIIIHPAKADSLIKSKSANMFTTTDSAGRFVLSNLKEQEYKIFALKEENGNRFYNEGELIGFYKPTIIPSKKTDDSIKIKIFKEEPKKLKIVNKEITKNGVIKIAFNKEVKNEVVKVLYPMDTIKHKFLYNLSDKRDSVKLYFDLINKLDSVKICLEAKDFEKDTITFQKNTSDKIKSNLNLKNNISSDILRPLQKLTFESDLPIEEICEDRIKLKEDTNFVKDLKFEKKNRFKFSINYEWKPNTKYEVHLQDSSIIGMNHIYNKESIKKFKYEGIENYGNIILHFSSKDTTKNYIVEINSIKSKETIFTGNFRNKKTINIQTIPIDKYQIKIVEDSNSNNKWDTGNLDLLLDPEKIYIYPKTLNIKANWDMEEKIEVE